MGFRTPLTTPTAVDTGPTPADAGVRLYQGQSAPGVAQGIAEWRTGRMARNATVTLSGGGSGGSSFVIDGGNPGVGPDAPTHSYNVETLPAGGYGRVVRTSTDWERTTGFSTRDTDANGAYPGLIAGVVTWPNNDYRCLRYLLKPDGLVYVTGMVLVNTPPANGQITSHAGGYAPLDLTSVANGRKGVWHVISGGVSGTPRLLEVRPTGIFLQGAAPVAGNWISINGLYESSLRTPT